MKGLSSGGMTLGNAVPWEGFGVLHRSFNVDDMYSKVRRRRESRSEFDCDDELTLFCV